MAADHPIIIIGSGLAGYNVAREFRKLNKTTELILVADDAAEFYSKPMLSNALEKNKTAAELVVADAEKMADDLNAKILKHTRIEKIDPDNNVVHTNKNESINYSQLVLALGASTIVLPVEGNATDKIFTVNDLADYAEFRQAIVGKKKIAIIGAGLIGCEFANDLALSDYDVSVIGISEQPLTNLLPTEAGAYLKTALSKKGINWYLGQETKQINFDNENFQIDLKDGTRLEVDVVLSAVGLKPNTQVANDASITVNKGIVVNKYLETNYKNIFALGDCAEIENLFLPYVMPLMNSARALAKSLNGEKTAVSFPAMPVMVKTPTCAVVASPPALGIEGSWEIKEDEEGVHARFLDHAGLLQGFALVGKAVADKQTLLKELPAVLA